MTLLVCFLRLRYFLNCEFCFEARFSGKADPAYYLLYLFSLVTVLCIFTCTLVNLSLSDRLLGLLVAFFLPSDKSFSTPLTTVLIILSFSFSLSMFRFALPFHRLTGSNLFHSTSRAENDFATRCL